MRIEKKEDILKLFKDIGVVYLRDYPLEVEGLENVDLTDSDYYRDNLDEFQYLLESYGAAIRARKVGPVYITSTDSRGYGLFASKDIREGDFLGIYFGVVKPQDEQVTIDETGLGTDYAWDYPDEIEGIPYLEIDAKPQGSEMRFANHDYDSNLDVEHVVVDNCWYIFFIANRDIKEDEELTISYGESYWDTEYREISQ